MNAIDTVAPGKFADCDIDLSDLDLPPAISPRSTRKERQFAHAAKMAGKRYNREHGIFAGESPTIRSYNQLRKSTGYTSIATGNRHGGEHQHAREIMRRTMTPFQRRAFAAALAMQIAEQQVGA